MRLPQPHEPWLWQLIANIRDILWPAPDEYEEDAPERQWSSDTVQAVGELMAMDGFGPERELIADPFTCPTCPGGAKTPPTTPSRAGGSGLAERAWALLH